ncbi:TPA: HNH endonuclease, partial [Klebsiella pneumoniae]|nr:HNH endonuclease [Klebsiella pneumoniae]
NMIDHIDGNRENNKINNLREATAEQNMWNSAAGKNNKTGVKGVSWDGRRKRFRASISIKGKNKEIGSYLSLKDAESAIKDYRLKLHGKFANNEVINNNLLEG